MRPTNATIIWSGARPRSARPLRGPRVKTVEISTGCDDVDLAGVGAIHRFQLAGLGGGVGDEAVGDVDDLLFADDPQARFLGVAVSQRRVLDGGKGVRGVTSGTPQRLAANQPTWPDSQ